ncbi:MraZ protein [Palleronia aestuarii]|uniref:Transcriptional regulator MraZ n=1 Tax=Palleronia aestuarii TaxID=568105 RepID=A0A2W7Q3Q1_9RHOB|nr:cell division/cell wall cluster transcriptional repressor MraZ [Palleronia aestuarii]PZX16269.1 MraZ protein [Palleronia aestuarii]
MFGLFIGDHDNKIDGKGRLSIPADFRRELEDGDPNCAPGGKASMVLVYGDHRRNYLEVLPIKEMMKRAKKIAKMSNGSQKRDDLQKLYYRQASTLTVDDTGRIVLSAKIRDKLGLTDSARVVGNGETFLIWNPDEYDTAPMGQLEIEEGYDPDKDPNTYLPGDDDDD